MPNRKYMICRYVYCDTYPQTMKYNGHDDDEMTCGCYSALYENYDARVMRIAVWHTDGIPRKYQVDFNHPTYAAWCNFIEFYDTVYKKKHFISEIGALIKDYNGFNDYRGIGFELEEDYVAFLLRFS